MYYCNVIMYYYNVLLYVMFLVYIIVYIVLLVQMFSTSAKIVKPPGEKADDLELSISQVCSFNNNH